MPIAFRILKGCLTSKKRKRVFNPCSHVASILRDFLHGDKLQPRSRVETRLINSVHDCL